MYQACFSAGSLSGALRAAYVIQKGFQPQFTFTVMGGFILLSFFAIYFLGLLKIEENSDSVSKFKLPDKKPDFWCAVDDEFCLYWDNY